MDEFEIYDKISQAGLTPNEYFLLGMICLNLPKHGCINFETTKRLLKAKNFLDKSGKPTTKVKTLGLFPDADLELIEVTDSDLNEKIEQYIGMFPDHRLESGSLAKQDFNLVKRKFIKFFQSNNYSWDTIYAATANYLEFYQTRGYKFMRNCAYFIWKDDSSVLSMECARVINTLKNAKHSFSKDI